MGTGSNDELAIRSFYFDQAEPVRLTLPYLHARRHASAQPCWASGTLGCLQAGVLIGFSRVEAFHNWSGLQSAIPAEIDV